jgi:hypothetical protein
MVGVTAYESMFLYRGGWLCTGRSTKKLFPGKTDSIGLCR